jgi:hypothetical protein
MSSCLFKPTKINFKISGSLSLSYPPSPSAGFTPVGSPVVYLDSDTLTGLSDNDPIDTWANAGSGANFTGSGAARPTLQSGAGDLLNTHPTVKFAAAQEMVSGITLDNEGITIFGVFKTDTLSDKYFIGAEGASPFTKLVVGSDNGDAPFSFWKGSTFVQSATIPNLVATTWYIMAVVINEDGTSSIYVNDASSAGHVTAATEATWDVALSPTGYRGLIGSMANILVYDSILSGADINTNISGLNTKYSIY